MFAPHKYLAVFCFGGFMQEIWKDVKGYEGLYQVSSLGGVKSKSRVIGNRKIAGRTLKPSDTSRGYLGVTLYKHGSKKTEVIHRLVANAFIPKVKNKLQINHIDGNKHNNKIDNLEWCNGSENLKHAFALGLKKPSKTFLGKFGENHPNSKKVIQYDLNNNKIREFACLSVVQREFNFNLGNLSECCNGKRKTAYGYIWRYVDEQNNIQPDCNG